MLRETLGRDDARAERCHALPQRLVADRRRDARARCAAELNRRGADTPGATVDQEPLAAAQTGLGEEGVVRCGEHLRDSARRRPVEPVRHGHQNPFVNDGELRLAAAADDRHHPIRDGEATRSGAEGDDLASQLEPGDVLGRSGRRRIAAEPLMHVGAVQARGPNPHKHLPDTGHGVWMLLDGQLSVTNRHRLHRCAQPYRGTGAASVRLPRGGRART